MTGEMTDSEVREQVERADRFIADLREMIAATVVDPDSPCADAKRRGLRRGASTLDAVPFVTFCNLANLNAAMRGGLLDLIKVGLLAVGRTMGGNVCVSSRFAVQINQRRARSPARPECWRQC